jgi:hypothetical protein
VRHTRDEPLASRAAIGMASYFGRHRRLIKKPTDFAVMTIARISAQRAQRRRQADPVRRRAVFFKHDTA